MSGEGGAVDYSTWSKEELIEKVRKLECHVKQLRNVIAKSGSSADLGGNPQKRPRLQLEGDDGEDQSGSFKKGKKEPRKFDFTMVKMRHVALKILYLGWDYQGLAAQEDTNETIEAYLFKALTTTRLIEERSKSNYNRCGRTDKGVSSFSQVISIDVRSKEVDGVETLDYCKMLNKSLPKAIRVIAWSPVQQEFSARFNCCRRTYKYFFPRGELDLERMGIAAKYLVGQHDFRNFCKLDKEEKSTIRTIMDVEFGVACQGKETFYDLCVLTIHGASFIWHQIRCIVAILVLVGKGMEDPAIVKELLDLGTFPQKPQYSMAIDIPLCLYDVEYPAENNIQWSSSTENTAAVVNDLQELWLRNAVKASMIKEMLQDLAANDFKSASMTDTIIMGNRRKNYLKLKDRPVCANY